MENTIQMDENWGCGTVREEAIKNFPAYPGVLKCYRWKIWEL
jgi:hypothetical protein